MLAQVIPLYGATAGCVLQQVTRSAHMNGPEVSSVSWHLEPLRHWPGLQVGISAGGILDCFSSSLSFFAEALAAAFIFFSAPLAFASIMSLTFLAARYVLSAFSDFASFASFSFPRAALRTLA